MTTGLYASRSFHFPARFGETVFILFVGTLAGIDDTNELTKIMRDAQTLKVPA